MSTLAQDPAAKFWDRIAQRYSNNPVADEATYQKKLRITREYLSPEMEVLEFGCGTGSTAITHAPHVKHIRAIDISAKMLEIARGKAAAQGVENVSFEHCTLDELQLPAQSVDVVLGLSILHLLEDHDAAIARVHALLKPGGVFVSSTACIADAMKFFKYIAPIGRALGLLPLLEIFGVDDLVASLTAAGFTIEQQWQPGKRKGVFIVAKKAG